MLGDAISAKKASGEAAESLEVVDVAQLLVRSVRPASGAGAAPAGGSALADGSEPAVDPAPADGSTAAPGPVPDGPPAPGAPASG